MDERKVNFICTGCSGGFVEIAEFDAHSCNDVKRKRGDSAEIARLRGELDAAQTECELWRMRLVACGVAATSDTPESLDRMLAETADDYRSATLDDVVRTVRALIAVRAELELERGNDGPSPFRIGDRVKVRTDYVPYSAMPEDAAARMRGRGGQVVGVYRDHVVGVWLDGEMPTSGGLSFGWHQVEHEDRLTERLRKAENEADALRAQLRAAVDPVRHWFDGDGAISPTPTDADIARTAVEELQRDRAELVATPAASTKERGAALREAFAAFDADRACPQCFGLRTYSTQCSDRECGDSTWDHACDAKFGAPCDAAVHAALDDLRTHAAS